MSKRRGAGDGHIEKITLRSGKTAWRGWLTVGYRPNGTPIRRTAQRRTRDEVRDAIVKLREKYRVGLDLAAESQTRLDALFEKWLAHFQATAEHKRRTPDTYQWAINRAKARLGNPLIARISAIELQDAITALGAELKPKSLNLIRVVLKGAFRQAQLWKIRSDNSAENLMLPRAKEEYADDRRILGADDAQRLLQALTEERLGLAVAFTYVLGIRPGEAAALRQDDFDMDAGTVTIRASHNVVSSGVVIRETTKSRRGIRTILLPPEMRPWLVQHFARMRNERAAMGARWSEPHESLLFVRETDGGKLDHRMIYTVARRVAEQAGMGNVGPRILRRSMLSHLARAGVDPKVRASLGGHTKEVTEEYYREVAQGEVDAAMRHMSPVLAQLSVLTDKEEVSE